MSEPIVSGVSPEETDDEIATMIKEGEAMVGVDSEGESKMMGIFARRPEMFEAFLNYSEAALRSEESLIQSHTKELMRLKSAEINRCTGCQAVRYQDVVDKVEPLEDEVLGEFTPEKLTDREALAVRFAEKMGGDPHQISDSFYTELKEEFSEDEIVELVFTECVYKMGHCLNNTLQAGRGSEELEYPMESARETSPTLSDD